MPAAQRPPAHQPSSALAPLHSAIAYLCAALSPTLDICILALAGYVISVLFFTGLIINWRDIPGARPVPLPGWLSGSSLRCPVCSDVLCRPCVGRLPPTAIPCLLPCAPPHVLALAAPVSEFVGSPPAGYWAWFADLSYMRYAWGTVMINEFRADPRAFGTVPVSRAWEQVLSTLRTGCCG